MYAVSIFHRLKRLLTSLETGKSCHNCFDSERQLVQKKKGFYSCWVNCKGVSFCRGLDMYSVYNMSTFTDCMHMV